MRWLDVVRMRIRLLLQRGQEARRLDSELEFHFEQQVAENIASGMTPEEAHRAARLKFGHPAQLREQVAEVWSWNGLETFMHDLLITSRTLRRTPGFSLATVLVIALGVGAITALFTVVHSVVLKPLPFRDAERLVRLYEHSSDDKFPYNVIAGGVFAAWRQESHDFSDMAILTGDSGDYSLSGVSAQLPEKVRAAMCSWNLFPMLGVEAALGRTFTEADDTPSASATVVLSWGVWKRRFGGDPSIVNHTVHLDAKPYTVTGIMPAWFAYPEQSVQLWTPIYHEQPPQEMQALDSHDFVAVGRLKTGVTERQAEAELSLIVKRLHDQHLDNPFISKAAHLKPLIDDIVGDIRLPLYALLAATICVLLIACLNVASLLIARATVRRKDLAIRTALGGSQSRLLCEHLIESFILSATGGAVGLTIAYAAIQWFIQTRTDMPRIQAIHIDAVVATFAVVLIGICTIFTAMASHLSFHSDQLLPALQESSRSQTASHGRIRLRKWLLSAQVGLTFVLLIAAGLLLKSYTRLRSADLGCITTNVLTMRFNLPEAKYAQPTRRIDFFETLLNRVRSLPGVEAAGLARAVPGQGYWGDGGFAIAEHPPLPRGQSQYAMIRWADPDYFRALGIPFLQGRTFDLDQRQDAANQVIISSAFARQFFPGEDAIGKHLIAMGRRTYSIIGVVGDTRFLPAKPAQPMMYFPINGAFVPDSATLAIRSNRDATAIALPIQRIVQQLDQELAVADILTMDQIVGKSTIDARFNATLLIAFAVLSLVLAAVGLFGVLSYIVAVRTSEIGIRVALGAQRQQVLRLVLADGLRPVFSGVILGIFGSLGIGRLISSMLYGTRPLDPAIFTAVMVLLMSVAVAACLVPAWRASRFDPVIALRNE